MLTPRDKRLLSAGTLMRRTCRSGQEPDSAGKSTLRLGRWLKLRWWASLGYRGGMMHDLCAQVFEQR